MRTVVDPLSRLGFAPKERRQHGLERRLMEWPRGPDGVLDLAGDDYLGLARSPDVVAGAVAGGRRYGTGSSGSPAPPSRAVRPHAASSAPGSTKGSSCASATGLLTSFPPSVLSPVRRTESPLTEPLIPCRATVTR
jgi:hypothetical protein